MTIEEIKKFLAENKDDESVKAFVSGLNPLSVDRVQQFVTTDPQGKSWIDSIKDKHLSKGLESWKQNNLDSLIDEEVKKRNPQKSPAELEVEKLRKEIEDERKARNHETLVNKALKVADEKHLPKDVLNFFIGEDEETTTANLGKLEETFNKAVQAGVDAKFKAGGRQVHTGGSGDNAGEFGKKLAEQNKQNSQAMETAQKNYFGEN